MAVSFTEELRSLLAAGVPLIHLVTHEEERTERMIDAAAAALKLGVVRWDVADGFAVVRNPAEPFAVKDCAAGEDALRHIAEKLVLKNGFRTADIFKRHKPVFNTFIQSDAKRNFWLRPEFVILERG